MFLVKLFITALVCFATLNASGAETKITSYDPADLLAKIFNPNQTITPRQRGQGLVFEDQDSSIDHYGDQYGQLNKRTKFQNLSNSITFQDDNFHGDENNSIRFRDDQTDQNIRDQTTDQGKKRRRRRRKPKKGLQSGGYLREPIPHGVNPGFPDVGPNPYQNQGFGPNYVPPGYPGPVPYRRRRRPSLGSEALTAVTGALTSIALYDDYQCVPRLLCEAAGGGSLGSNALLNSVAGIQPLLTLLSAYNGLSSSPLFVFGRAVFLGMTSQGNTGTCRYAYPQCPTDPEQLIHYLNNHNGGFFRFFNAPPNQNLEQFYNHLGQNGQFGPDGYGYDQNQPGFGQNGQVGQDGYGYGQNQQGFGQNGQQGYGLYQNHPSGYGFYQNNHIGNRPELYTQNYGSNYDYNTYGSKRFKNSNAQIEKRIQNKPKDDIDIENGDSNWQFPDDDNFDADLTDDDGTRENDSLKFPEESLNNNDISDTKRKGKSILFPENQFNQNAYSNKNYQNIKNQDRYNAQKQSYQNYNTITKRPYYHNYNQRFPNYNTNNYNNYITTTESHFNENDYYFDYKHNFYVKKQKNNNNNYSNNINNFNNKQYVNNNVNSNEAGVQTVYIVRGHGDPNRPEIVKVRPGQTVS